MTDDFKDSLSSLSAIKQTTNPQRKPTLQLCLTYKHNSEMRCLRHSGRCQTINVCKWGPGRDVMGLAVRRPIGVLDALLPHAPPLGLLTRVSSERWFFARVVRPLPPHAHSMPGSWPPCVDFGASVNFSCKRNCPPTASGFFPSHIDFRTVGNILVSENGYLFILFYW